MHDTSDYSLGPAALIMPAVPLQSPAAVDKPKNWMAKIVLAMETTKNTPDRMPRGANTCRGAKPVGTFIDQKRKPL